MHYYACDPLITNDTRRHGTTASQGRVSTREWQLRAIAWAAGGELAEFGKRKR